MIEDHDATREGRPVVEWVISGLVALVAVGGAIAIATALLLFMPGSNGLDAAQVEEILSADPLPVTTTIVAAGDVGASTAVPVTSPAPTTGDSSTTAVTATPVTATPATEVAEVRIIAYRVRRGDTLALIGRAFGVDWRELAVINSISDPNVIASGIVLQVPVVDDIGNIEAVTNADLAALTPTFDAAAAEMGVAPELLKAVVWVDSGWGSLDVDGVIANFDGPVLSLIEPQVGAAPDLTDTEASVRAAAAYLSALIDQAEGDASAAAAAYFERVTSTRDIQWGAETVAMVGDMLAVRSVFATS